MKTPIRKPAKKIIPLPALKIYFDDLEYPHRIAEVAMKTGLSQSAIAQMAIRVGIYEVEQRLTGDLPSVIKSKILSTTRQPRIKPLKA